MLMRLRVKQSELEEVLESGNWIIEAMVQGPETVEAYNKAREELFLAKR